MEIQTDDVDHRDLWARITAVRCADFERDVSIIIPDCFIVALFTKGAKSSRERNGRSIFNIYLKLYVFCPV